MYNLLRSILFRFSPEAAHHLSMSLLRAACSMGWLRNLLARFFRAKGQKGFDNWGLHYPNKVGLAAGFDKNACYLRELETLGFGFVEIGTVTPLGQPGNDKPRVFRLPADKGLINRMGFNNEGVKAVAQRLRAYRSKHTPMIIGGNIGKNKVTPNEDAWKDYEICFRELADCVDYFVVNVSSPNTPGLRALQEKESLRRILTHLQVINNEREKPLPLLLKIAPDLGPGELDDVADLALEIRLDGLVVSNTTISREGLTTDAEKVKAMGAGGLSGAPVRQKSTEVLKYIIAKTGGKIPVIASGGIFTAADAKEKLDAGACLVQVWTGFIYEGPMIAKKIASSI